VPSHWASSAPRLATAGLLALAGLWRAAQVWPARPVFPNGPDLSLWLDAIVAARSFDLADLAASGRPYVYPMLAAALPLPVGDAGTALSYVAWALLPAVTWLSACRLAGPIPALLPTAIAWGSMRFAEAVPFTNAQTLLDLLVVAYVGFAPGRRTIGDPSSTGLLRPEEERCTVAFVALGLGLGLVKEQGLLVGVGAALWALASGARWAAVARGVALAALPYLVTMGLETWLVGRPPKAVLPLADLLGLSGFGGQRPAAAIPFERQLAMNVNTLRLFFQTHEWVVGIALLAVPLARARGPGARVGLWLACVVAFFGVALVVMFQRYHLTTGLALLTLGTVWIPARWAAVGSAESTYTMGHDRTEPAAVAVAAPRAPSPLRVLLGVAYAGVLLGWVPYWAADQARGRTFVLTRSPSHQNARVLTAAVEQLHAFPDDAPVACLESSIARVAGRSTIALADVRTLPCGSPVLWSNPLPPIIAKDLARELREWPVRWRGSVPGMPDLRLSVIPCAAEAGAADPPAGPDTVTAKPDGGERQDERGD
jgi:hypothetical protein